MGVTTEILRELMRVCESARPDRGDQSKEPEAGPAPLSTEEALQRTLARVESEYTRAVEGSYGVTSGLQELDEAVHGWRPGELVFIGGERLEGARPLLVQLLLHNGLDESRPCAHMSPRRATERAVVDLLSELSGLSRWSVRIGSLSDEQWPQLLKACGRLTAAKIFWDDTPWASTAKFVERCQMLVEREDVAAIFIDGVQWLWGNTGRGPMNDNRAKETLTRETLRALKQMAVALEVPVIAFGASSAEQAESATFADIDGADAIADWADEIYLVSQDLPERFDGKELDGVLLEFVKTRVADRRSVLLEYGRRTGSFSKEKR